MPAALAFFAVLIPLGFLTRDVPLLYLVPVLAPAVLGGILVLVVRVRRAELADMARGQAVVDAIRSLAAGLDWSAVPDPTQRAMRQYLAEQGRQLQPRPDHRTRSRMGDRRPGGRGVMTRLAPPHGRD
jgi:hypothetical protein